MHGAVNVVAPPPARYFVRVIKREKRACRKCADGGVTAASMLEWNPVLNETAIEGLWNFDIGFGIGLARDQVKQLTIFDSVEKLGLKLEKRDVPTPVLVVDSVIESPTPKPGVSPKPCLRSNSPPSLRW